MKVTTSQQLPSQQAPNTRPAHPPDGEMPGVEPAPATGTRSFASVLDSTPNGDDGGFEPEPGKQPETPNQQSPVRAPEERKSREIDDGAILSVAPSIVPPDSQIDSTEFPAPPTAREILPAADLENILLTVRTEIVAGGQPQTIIDLPRSMLEGLRVRLSTDRAGRISAEFVAKTEAVRAQVDARSTDLVDMLRFRGINLSGLSSSVSTELNSGDDSRRRYPPGTGEVAAAGSVPAGNPSSSSEVARQQSESDDRFTYRA